MTMGERVVRLVASLTGPAANMLIGMTMGQLDDWFNTLPAAVQRYLLPLQSQYIK